MVVGVGVSFCCCCFSLLYVNRPATSRHLNCSVVGMDLHRLVCTILVYLGPWSLAFVFRFAIVGFRCCCCLEVGHGVG